jgi:hypothetical protein
MLAYLWNTFLEDFFVLVFGDLATVEVRPDGILDLLYHHVLEVLLGKIKKN